MVASEREELACCRDQPAAFACRALAFRQCAAEWMEKREERQWRDDAAAAIRCGVAAAAYAATGNIFAPIATSLGGMRGYKQNS